MRRCLAVAAVAALLATIGGPTAGAEPASARETKRFFFLTSINNAGFVDVCGCKQKKVKQGSLSRRATVVKTLRAEGKPFVLVDGGSCFFNIQDTLPKPFERDQFLAKAFVIVESMNRMGYQAMAVGSSDLLLGLEELKKLEKVARFPLLCANFAGPDGALIFKPYTILEIGGVRIGVIGLILGTLNPRYLERLAPGCKATDPIAAAKQFVPELKSKVDLVVALSHARSEENRRLGDEVPDIRIIFDPNINYGSHSVFLPEAETYVDRFGAALVVRADGEGMRLARVDVEFEVPHAEVKDSPELNRLEKGVMIDPIPADMAAILGRGDFNRAAVSRISIEPHFLADADIEALVDNWKKQEPGQIAPEKLQGVKAAAVTYVGKEACRSCHKEQYDFWATTKHAKAFNSLKETGDHLRYDCIGCHTVGFGQAFYDVKDAEKFADVQCECCHGTNPKHVGDPAGAPRWAPITEQTCLVCHNEHQIRVPFDFQASLRPAACPKAKSQ